MDISNMSPEEYDKLLTGMEREGFNHLKEILKQDKPVLDKTIYEMTEKWYEAFLPCRPRNSLDIYQLKKHQPVYNAARHLYYNIVEYVLKEGDSYIFEKDSDIKVYNITRQLEFLLYLIALHNGNADDIMAIIPERQLKLLAFFGHMSVDVDDMSWYEEGMRLIMEEILNARGEHTGKYNMRLLAVKGFFISGIVNDVALTMVKSLEDKLPDIAMTEDVYAEIKEAATNLHKEHEYSSGSSTRLYVGCAGMKIEDIRYPSIKGAVKRAIKVMSLDDPEKLASLLGSKMKVLLHLMNVSGGYGKVSSTYRKAYVKLIVNCFATAVVMDTSKFNIRCKEATKGL